MGKDDDSRGSAEAASFEARLHAARQRQGLEPQAEGQRRRGGLEASMLGIALRVGVEMVSAMAVAVAIGWALDRWLHTRPVLLAVFVLLGGAAGVANVWRLISSGRLSGDEEGNRASRPRE